MKTILVAVAIATTADAKIEEPDVVVPPHIVAMCQQEGGCALVTKQAMSDLSVRMFKAGMQSASKEGCMSL